MPLMYKSSKIMSNYITIDVGITDGSIDPMKTLVSFRNFRNLLDDGVIPLNDTTLSGPEISIEQVTALFTALLSIYEGSENIAKLSQDSKLQGESITQVP